MKIKVKVKAQAKSDQVIKISNEEYIVKTTAPAIENKANEKVIELIADYFKVKKSAVRLIKGVKNKEKAFEIIQ